VLIFIFGYDIGYYMFRGGKFTIWYFLTIALLPFAILGFGWFGVAAWAIWSFFYIRGGIKYPSAYGGFFHKSD
jgi:hypothetical protein